MTKIKLMNNPKIDLKVMSDYTLRLLISLVEKELIERREKCKQQELMNEEDHETL